MDNRTTEQTSKYDHLDRMSTLNLLTAINTEDRTVPVAVSKAIPAIEKLVTGSTRMKAGTAQKLVLNMISTASMIRLGHVKGSKMVDMQLTNHKLVDRGTRMIMDETGLEDYDQARALLLAHGSVRAAVSFYQHSNSSEEQF